MVCHHIIMECIMVMVVVVVVVVSFVRNLIEKREYFEGRGRGGRGRGRFRQRGGANKENQPQNNSEEGKTGGKI
jgi:hypothetical protein